MITVPWWRQLVTRIFQHNNASIVLSQACFGGRRVCWVAARAACWIGGQPAGAHTSIGFLQCRWNHLQWIFVEAVLVNDLFWDVYKLEAYLLWAFEWCHQVEIWYVYCHNPPPSWGYDAIGQYFSHRHVGCRGCHFAGIIYAVSTERKPCPILIWFSSRTVQTNWPHVTYFICFLGTSVLRPPTTFSKLPN